MFETTTCVLEFTCFVICLLGTFIAYTLIRLTYYLHSWKLNLHTYTLPNSHVYLMRYLFQTIIWSVHSSNCQGVNCIYIWARCKDDFPTSWNQKVVDLKGKVFPSTHMISQYSMFLASKNKASTKSPESLLLVGWFNPIPKNPLIWGSCPWTLELFIIFCGVYDPIEFCDVFLLKEAH